MSSSLFRQQAIEERKDRLYGEVIITQPLSFYLITFGTLIVVICIALLLIYGTYARRENVEGYLVPDKGLVKVYAPLHGIVTKKHIKEGQLVAKGDLLLTISTLKSNDQGGDKDALLLTELEQQKRELKNKIQQEKDLSQKSLNSLKSQLEGIKREAEQLASSLSLQQKQVKILTKKRVNLNNLLAKGHVSVNQLKDAEQAELSAMIQLQSLVRQKTQLQNKSNELALQQQRIPLEWQSKQVDFNRNLSEIEQRIVEISGRRVYSIRSPISGRLTALQIAEGQTVNTQAPLIAILPEGTQLQAELFLPTRAAGFIAKDQSVYLRYGAFPYQHYGLHLGKVENITQVILSPKELPIPMALNEPVYRVKVLLDSQTVDAYGKQFPLQAGMLLDADIVLEKRTLGQWLLEPIYGLKGKL